jgi:hypothetical protein
MKINDAFPSNYLKASDFEGDTVVTIKNVTLEDIGQGKKQETKAIVHFDEFDKGLVLNVTNKNAIEGLYGDETDDWTGKQITLFPTEVEFAGEQVMAIRVRLRKPVSAAPANGNSATAAMAKQQALDAFKKANEGATQQEKKEGWVKLLRETCGDKHPNDYMAADWHKIRLAATPPPESPLSAKPEFADADIPF